MIKETQSFFLLNNFHPNCIYGVKFQFISSKIRLSFFEYVHSCVFRIGKGFGVCFLLIWCLVVAGFCCRVKITPIVLWKGVCWEELTSIICYILYVYCIIYRNKPLVIYWLTKFHYARWVQNTLKVEYSTYTNFSTRKPYFS